MRPKLFCIVLSLIFFSQAKAQIANQSFLILGIQTPILSNGLGYEVGLRTQFWGEKHLGLNAQLSFNHFHETSTFLSGESVKGNSSNLLFGPSFHFLIESKLKPTILLMGGLQSNYQQHSTRGNNLELSEAISTEFQITIRQKNQLGIYLQSPGFVGLRVSCNLQRIK